MRWGLLALYVWGWVVAVVGGVAIAVAFSRAYGFPGDLIGVPAVLFFCEGVISRTTHPSDLRRRA